MNETQGFLNTRKPLKPFEPYPQPLPLLETGSLYGTYYVDSARTHKGLPTSASQVLGNKGLLHPCLATSPALTSSHDHGWVLTHLACPHRKWLCPGAQWSEPTYELLFTTPSPLSAGTATGPYRAAPCHLCTRSLHPLPWHPR